MSSSSSGLQLALPSAKKQRLDTDECRQLVAQPRQSRAAIINTLELLKRNGQLAAGATKRQLAAAAAHHANHDTPYGKVVQRVHLGLPKLEYLDIVHPFALMFYLCQLSVAFASMMYECARSGNPVRLVVYLDGMNPGNPFRPEASRKLLCVYWALVDWPAHVLGRTFAWPVIAIIREAVVKTIPGATSYICRLILKTFFPDEGHSFARGIMLPLRDQSFMVCGVFVGFLCDLLGHKENTHWKGTNGNVFCMVCANGDQRVRGHRAGCFGLDCADPKRFVKRTNESVYNDVDELTTRCAATPAQTLKLQTEYGFNVVPNGLLQDASLRDIFKPVDHFLEDWMHTMVGDGVANSVIGETLNVLKGLKYPMQSVRDFMMQCTLPSKYGRANADWLKDSRIKLDTVKSFAGIVLTLVPILYLL